MASQYVMVKERKFQRLNSTNATYATARTGGTLNLNANLGTCGQALGYNCYQAWLEFDMTTIPAGSTITAVSYTASHVNDTAASPEWDIEVYDAGQWAGSSLAASDYLAPADLGIKLAYKNTAAIGTGLKGYVGETADFVAAAQSALDGNRSLNLVHVSSRWIAGTTPDETEYVQIDGEGYMVVTYTPPTADETDVIVQTATNDYYIYCSSATYTTARAGTGTLGGPSVGDGVIGQGAGTFFCYQTLAEIDISGIPLGAIITAVAIRIYYASVTVFSAHFNVLLAKYDWGAAVGTEDFQSHTEMIALRDNDQIIGTDNTAGISAAAWGSLLTNTKDCSGIQLLQAAVDAEDATFKYIMYSEEQEFSVEPTSSNYVRPEMSNAGPSNYGAEWSISYYIPDGTTMNVMILGAVA